MSLRNLDRRDCLFLCVLALSCGRVDAKSSTKTVNGFRIQVVGDKGIGIRSEIRILIDEEWRRFQETDKKGIAFSSVPCSSSMLIRAVPYEKGYFGSAGTVCAAPISKIKLWAKATPIRQSAAWQHDEELHRDQINHVNFSSSIPVCEQPIGTIALVEPELRWWSDLGLGSPEAVIRVFVQKSKCFKLVNRSNRGLAAMQQERALAAGGETRRGGSIGKGQMVEADFTFIPDIGTANNKGGFNIGALAGAFEPGISGALLGGINIKKRSANVILNVVNNKSSEEIVTEGRSKKSDLGLVAGGDIFAGGAFDAAGASGYDTTELGQVIALAYLDAYTKLVSDLGGLTDAVAGPQAEKAVFLKNAGELFSEASLKSKVIKPLDAGAVLYPTGNKANSLWEVEDEIGAKGWLLESALEQIRTISQESEPVAFDVSLNKKHVLVLSYPNTNSSINSLFLNGDEKIKTTGRVSNQWWQVILPDGKIGWISEKNLRFVKTL